MNRRKPKSKHIRVKEPVQVSLSDALAGELQRFIEYHPARRLSRNLRSMLFEFLMADGAVEAVYLNDLLFDLEGLFELLDHIQHETEER